MDQKIHPNHEEAIVRHAVRNIPNASKLVDKWVEHKTGMKNTRLPDNRNDIGDGLKHFWN
jgi:hypothetical protein